MPVVNPVLTVPPMSWNFDVYMSLQTKVDDQIKQIMTTLNASDAATNTIVVFTSDHAGRVGQFTMRLSKSRSISGFPATTSRGERYSPHHLC
jgi:arylsulfatase A-like enzyme